MSTTFTIQGSYMVPCPIGACTVCNGRPLPSGTRVPCPVCAESDRDPQDCGRCYGDGYIVAELYLNVANGNARDLLTYLGLEAGDLYGSMRSVDLRKAIARVANVAPPARLGHIETAPHRATLIVAGREPGRMAEYIEVLSDLCALAGDLGVIRWA